MTDSLFEAVAHATRELTKYGFFTQEFAMLVQQHNMTDAEALAVALPLLDGLVRARPIWPRLLGVPAVSMDLGVTSLR